MHFTLNIDVSIQLKNETRSEKDNGKESISC